VASIIEDFLFLGKVTIAFIILLVIGNYSGYILNKLANKSPLKLSYIIITYYTIITFKGYIIRFLTKSPGGYK
jgi:F0F1-type ATP synthase assembly protein I